ALLADHRGIRRTVEDLRVLNRVGGPGAPEPSPQLRWEVCRLAEDLEMHLRRDEAAFGALGPGRSPAVA
ncbi:MAG TPA: hypothetical protein VGR90_10555, partial [Acidimicrobiales bacterium]|nr:hypothetical protein [Acidimicrobiales bacterium]